MDANKIHRFTLDNIFNVKDRVALVTGGGSGIGLMASLSLAVNGAKVYIVGRTREKLESVKDMYGGNIPGQIIPVTADMSSKDSIHKLVTEIESKEEALHILINNAGISSTKVNTDAEDPKELQQELFASENSNFEEWEKVFRTNVCQLFFTTTAFLPLLQKGTDLDHGWSSAVVNITSISGILKISQHHFAYNSSKAAAIHLTKMLAHEVTSSGLKIRVNNIAPGVFPSQMTASGGENKDHASGVPKTKYENIPAGRPGKDEDMAATVLFTVANQYLNGQTVVVDGGYVLDVGSI